MSETCKVTNRSTGVVAYRIPERHIRREFMPKETKEIDVQEISDVMMQGGGRELFYNYLLVEDKEKAEKVMNVHVEPEYWLTEKEIPSWLVTCSLDALKDALDFAPDGVKDLIKKYAVEIKLNDIQKRQAILDQLGFDVTKVIENIEADEREAIEKGLVSTGETTGRRVNPNYTKITIKEKED